MGHQHQAARGGAQEVAQPFDGGCRGERERGGATPALDGGRHQQIYEKVTTLRENYLKKFWPVANIPFCNTSFHAYNGTPSLAPF